MNNKRKIGAALALALAAAAPVQADTGVQGWIISEGKDGREDMRHVGPAQHRKSVAPLDGRVPNMPDLSHPQRLLVLVVGPNHLALPAGQIQSMFEGPQWHSLASYYSTQSNGRISFAPVTYVNLPQAGFNGCSASLGVEAADLLGQYSDLTGDKAVAFDHVFILGAWNDNLCPGAGWTGASSGNAIVSNQHGRYELGLSVYHDVSAPPPFVLAHEFGHQLGFGHSGICSDVQTCLSVDSIPEYKDFGDVMGFAPDQTLPPRLSEVRKMTYGWANKTRIDPSSYGQWFDVHSELAVVKKPIHVAVVPLQHVHTFVSHLQGRVVLTLNLEPEVVDTGFGGLPLRRAGLVPRLVGLAMPDSHMTLFSTSVPHPAQKKRDLVLSTPGVHVIPGTGLSVEVQSIGATSATFRVTGAPLPGGPDIAVQPTPPGLPCYDRRYTLTNASGSESVNSTGDRNAVMEPTFEQVNEGGTRVALFAGSGPVSANIRRFNADQSSDYWMRTAPAVTCSELPPVLTVSHTRDPATCQVSTTASNAGSASTLLRGFAGPQQVSFLQQGSWMASGTDPRSAFDGAWYDADFTFLGLSYLAPSSCAGIPMPKLTITAGSATEGCTRAEFTVAQSAAGIPGSTFEFRVVNHGSAPLTTACILSGTNAGNQTCVVTAAQSLSGVRFVATAVNSSDMTVLKGQYSCKQ